jgi:hypothetical protein
LTGTGGGKEWGWGSRWYVNFCTFEGKLFRIRGRGCCVMMSVLLDSTGGLSDGGGGGGGEWTTGAFTGREETGCEEEDGFVCLGSGE